MRCDYHPCFKPLIAASLPVYSMELDGDHNVFGRSPLTFDEALTLSIIIILVRCRWISQIARKTLTNKCSGFQVRLQIIARFHVYTAGPILTSLWADCKTSVISREFIASTARRKLSFLQVTLQYCRSMFSHNLWCCNTYSKLPGINVDFATGPSDVKIGPVHAHGNRLLL